MGIEGPSKIIIAGGNIELEGEVQDCIIISGCLLYTSDAADERSSVDLGGRRIIKQKNTKTLVCGWPHTK